MTIAFVFFSLMAIAASSGDTGILNLVIYNISNNITLVAGGFLVLILFALGFGYWFFRSFTTKICGPIYNIHLRVQEHLNGQDNVQIQIRKDDFYHDLVDDLNKVFKKK